MSVATQYPSNARSGTDMRCNLVQTKHIGIALFIAVCTIIVCTSAFADDTELYFANPNSRTDTSPNVLFVLDTSSSMDYSDTGQTGTRLQRLKSALNSILDSATNINVGLMRFNGTNGGGSVLYPVTYIDKPICTSNCGTLHTATRVSENNDDMAQFVDSGAMTQNGEQLYLGSEDNKERLVGLRFQNALIPSGATILSAVIEFTAERNDTSSTNLTIVGHDVDDAPSIKNTPYYLRDLDKTNASVNWQPGAWSTDDVFETPDLKDIVQEVTDRSDWCGGQSLGFVVSGSGQRVAYAYNGGNASASAILRVSYNIDNIPSNKGCTRSTAVTQVKAARDDAFEGVDGATYYEDDITIPQRSFLYFSRTTERLRFQNLNVPKNAVIDEAYVILESFEKRTGKASVQINVEKIDSALMYERKYHWISDQPLESNSVKWSIKDSDSWEKGTNASTPNLAPLVQKIVNRQNWKARNHIAFQFSAAPDHNTSNRRRFVSYDEDKSSAAILKVKYHTTVSATDQSKQEFITARTEMKEIVNDLTARSGTPIVASYLEAANYMLGGPVIYGKQRGFYPNTHQYHRVSHPDSYTGGTVTRDHDCTDANLDDVSCVSETIVGNVNYDSPIQQSCQTSHIVFLSDGEANDNTAISQVKALTGVSQCKPNYGPEACGLELAQWLYETDHRPALERDQNISTYTIGFNNDDKLLQNIATIGGGNYRDASSAQELLFVFQEILDNVQSVDTSFVGSGATVNQFNRLTHRNDLYYAMFKPDSKPRWPGNLKRYQADVNSDGVVEIQDRTGENAFDSDTGYFSAESKSFWGTGTDGDAVDAGGAANKMTLTGPDGEGTRQVYTVIGEIPANGANLSAYSKYDLHEDNANITSAMLGISGGSSGEQATLRTEYLKWARGVDVRDEDVDESNTDVRNAMGDPLHAGPVTLNYANGDREETTIFIGTNEGKLHAFEHENGTELFSFMPEEFLTNIGELLDNQQSTNHPYGFDGDLTIWHDDSNGNLLVDNNEKAYLFVGMRRGGNLYYAFDVSTRKQPKLLWKIQGGEGDFQNLGQTWSKPVATMIRRNGADKLVLIFGGGYDEANNDPNADNLVATPDGNNRQPQDNIGNSIYIADALTGTSLWSAAIDNSGSEKFTDMRYSFAADPRVVDTNADGLADQIYIGDMGGQVWRFDIAAYHSGGALVDGGVIARLGGSGIINARRFYSEPDVARIDQNGQSFLSVSIGSGWQAHPLNEAVEDRIYMIKQHSVYGKPVGYGKNTGTVSSPSYQPLTESDLVNVTDDLTPQLNDNGWYLKLEDTGEKISGTILTVNNKLIVPSYVPSEAGEPCSAEIGAGYAYIINVLNGAPTSNLQADDLGSGETIVYQGQTLDKSDRRAKLKNGGPPPSPSLLIVERQTSTPDSADSGATESGTDNSGNGANSGANSQTTDAVIASSLQFGLEGMDLDTGNFTTRTYWQDKGRGNRAPAEVGSSVAEAAE